jgi:hypothetical protein
MFQSDLPLANSMNNMSVLSYQSTRPYVSENGNIPIYDSQVEGWTHGIRCKICTIYGITGVRIKYIILTSNLYRVFTLHISYLEPTTSPG